MFIKQHAEAVKAALEISKRYDGKEMPGEDAEKFKSLVAKATEYKQLAQEEESLQKMQVDLSNSEVATTGKQTSQKEEKEGKKESFWTQVYNIAKFAKGPKVTTGAEIEQFLHKEGDPSLGGAFVVPDFDPNVSVGLAAFATIRPDVSVLRTNSKYYEFARIKGETATHPSDFDEDQWLGEGADIGDDGAARAVQNTPTTQLVRITAHLWAPKPIVITREMTQDAPMFEAALGNIFREHLGIALDKQYLNGDGIKQPRGILTYPSTSIPQVNSGAAAAITYNGLVNLKTALPQQYQAGAKFYFTQNTLGAILKLAGTANDHPFFAPGLIMGNLWGTPYVINQFMPEVAANNLAILYANLRYYRAVDRMDMEIQRLVERYTPHVALQMFGRFGGDVEMFQPFRIQKIAV